MLGITIYYAYTCYAYVTSIAEQGFVISENLADTIHYYLSTLTPYVFYTVCLITIGYILQQMKKILLLKSVNIEEEINEDIEYEELVKELQI